MHHKIVSDSSSNIFALDSVDYGYVPLKIISPEKEYVDTPELDMEYDAICSAIKEYQKPTKLPRGS